MKRYQITLNDRTFDVRLLSDPRQEQVQVEIDGQTFTVGVRVVPPAGPLTAPTSDSAPPALRPTEAVLPAAGTLTAPLPGTVKSVAVRPGQAVARGDELLVIEAMKMDNLIRAPQEGIIADVYVAPGQRIAHGEPLLSYRR
mgnify:CR=1 FL=1